MPENTVWSDWTPGVLSSRQVRALCEEGHLAGVPDLENALGQSAIDLTLTDECYLMPSGAVKPTGGRFFPMLQRANLISRLDCSQDGSFILSARQTYLIRLAERIHSLQDAGIFGQATAKSSVGRVDVLARLVVDGASGYESFSPKEIDGSSGELFLEVTPLTFAVKVKPGISLSQLRFFYGSPRTSELRDCPEAFRTFLKEASVDDGTLSANLQPAIVVGHEAIAFAARDDVDAAPPVPLWKKDERPSPCDYWKLVMADDNGRLSLRKNSFYIIRSKERIALPSSICVYCRAIDEVFGEMRIHYAGFVHPHFGRTRQDGQVGTPLIFEVRGHDVHVSLQDGEKMARLIFYRMSEEAESGESAYGDQALELSKFFGPWPSAICVDQDGLVAPAEDGQ